MVSMQKPLRQCNHVIYPGPVQTYGLGHDSMLPPARLLVKNATSAWLLSSAQYAFLAPPVCTNLVCCRYLTLRRKAFGTGEGLSVDEIRVNRGGGVQACMVVFNAYRPCCVQQSTIY